eukprot:18172-Eustigmatos_ZCMA.PRE.1
MLYLSKYDSTLLAPGTDHNRRIVVSDLHCVSPDTSGSMCFNGSILRYTKTSNGGGGSSVNSAKQSKAAKDKWCTDE